MHVVDRSTALHEAGHAVAHVRFRILAGNVTIAAKKTYTHLVRGSAVAEGAESVWSKTEAKPQILAYCAGYAALIAAGYGDEAARAGCDDDFEKATKLIEDWQLGTLDDWMSDAVEFMRQNIRATNLVADHLMRHETLDSDYIDVLVSVADGDCTDEEFKQYLELRAWRVA